MPPGVHAAWLRATLIRVGFAGACLVFSASWIHAQTPEEHASHHPGAAATTTMPVNPSATPAPGGMAAMGEMMKGMGVPPPREIYPTLMTLPELTPEKRREIELQADLRMQTGARLMEAALDTLNRGTDSGDYAVMHEAMMGLREGVAQLESGVAARRALAEGRAPRDVALAWFKREMRLAPLPVGAASPAERGLSVLHLFTMALLVSFACAMLAMYFFKMRRAHALFGRIDPGSPPPGSSPPPGGSPGPAAPPAPSAVTPGAEAAVPTTESRTDPIPSPGKPVTLPVPAKWQGRLRVTGIARETPTVLTFRLGAPGGGPLPFTFAPGQFLNVATAVGGAKMNRSYSISSSPLERDHVDLTIKREERGAVSRHLIDLLKVGDEIEAGGPVGKFTFTGSEAESVVLIGAGVGITPMMSIARYLTELSWPGEVYFIYGCRSPADLIFKQAIAALERRNPRLHVVITMSKPTPDWTGARGRITKEFLLAAVPALASRRVQLCGPPTMMEAAKALLLEIGVAPANLKTEMFGAVKAAPAVPGTSALPAADATGPQVTFSTNHKSARIRPDQTILELSETLGIGIDFACRVGTCGLCKVRMTAGEVDMDIVDALDEDDRAAGLILACQAKPKTEVTVEA